MIQLKKVSKFWDGGLHWAVREISLHVPQGTFLALVGESGSGKTTTLKLINRLEEPTAGTVEVEGRDIAAADPVALRRGMGWVLQAIALFPHLTAGENVAVVPRLLGWNEARIRTRVDELLDLVGLEPGTYRNRKPARLSGGQRQRVGVARALAAQPPILLMDEPFGALDPVTRSVLQDDVRRLHDALRLTTVMVTHDVAEALTMADRVAVMKDGRIVREGAPRELLRTPGHPYVAQLLATPLRNAEALHALREGA